MMLLKEYVENVLKDISVARGDEVTGNREVNFDIGIRTKSKIIYVDPESGNRVKFTVVIKRY